MSEDDAFVAAIRANPRDDVARLVYADWLDERNDPRGEWLRLEVQRKQFVDNASLYFPLTDRQAHLECHADIDPAWQNVVRNQASWHGGEISDWQAFYDALLIEPECRAPTVPKPVVVQLDDFEAEVGFRLPQSYRDYIAVFGPGKLLTDWDIAAPGYGRGWSYDLSSMNASIREPDAGEEQYYFCIAYKDCYCWNLNEVTDSDANEYAIYLGTERIASTFREFVEGIALSMLTLPDWDEEELGSPMRFELATIPS